MKVIIDACLSRSVYDAVKSICPDSIYVNDFPYTLSDHAIMRMADRLDAIILTSDTDFNDYKLAYIMETRKPIEAVNVLKMLSGENYGN